METVSPLVTGGASGILVGMTSLVAWLVIRWRGETRKTIAGAGHASQRVKDHETENAILLKQMESVHSENQRLTERVRQLEERLADRDKRVSELQGEVGKLQIQLTKINVELQQMRANSDT